MVFYETEMHLKTAMFTGKNRAKYERFHSRESRKGDLEIEEKEERREEEEAYFTKTTKDV